MAGPDLTELLADDSVVLELARAFNERDHELYLVGGVVRDTLLGRRAATPDLDLATDADPQTTRAIVEPRANDVWLQGI